MILFEKYGQHQPLNRQADRYAREGVPLSLSTLADQVGACCAVLAPLLRRVEAHVFAAERLHGDALTPHYSYQVFEDPLTTVIHTTAEPLQDNPWHDDPPVPPPFQEVRYVAAPR